MVVRIRLARFGKRHAPFYNIVVANGRTARNSRPLEVLGTYDPIPKQNASGEGRKYKDIKLDISRAKYWLGVGAQPSDPAWRLMAMVSLSPSTMIVKEESRLGDPELHAYGNRICS
ncbi:MAG: 37S ribosomal protein S16, mitochondrial [Bathelium mastoideum]|nr:MAG: 37S ribosomal protein S16, mitochondrial [Bathelium mastoideum]